MRYKSIYAFKIGTWNYLILFFECSRLPFFFWDELWLDANPWPSELDSTFAEARPPCTLIVAFVYEEADNRCTTSSWCLCICLSTWLGRFLSTLSKTYQPPLMTRNSKANLGKHWFFLCCSIDISYWHTKHCEEAPGKGFREG